MAVVIALDAGTTGVRALVLDAGGHVVDSAYRELTQHFPRPGWVEHDPGEIWAGIAASAAEVAARMRASGEQVEAVGITNQRETVVSWDRRSGEVLHNAIVWQDRRTAAACERMISQGHLPLVREHTGLLLDPYFSATKMRWLIEHAGVIPGPDVVMGTVDTWLVWNLTGAIDGGVVATDPSNASRTLLYDLAAGGWSDELCELFGIPNHVLAEVRPSCGRLGRVRGQLAEISPELAGTPVSGVAGDQQAALFGQACLREGMAKVTYGTGTFVLANAGTSVPDLADGLLSTVGWDLGSHGPLTYASEGSVFSTGATIQWLRDSLGLIASAPDAGPLAESAGDAGGVYLIPAFAGLGSPWWDPDARGALVGLTRGSGRAQVVRAAVESMAYQVRDVLDAMAAAGIPPPTEIRADGGASAMDLLLQLQADQSQVRVARAASGETTAIGAAMLAGLAEGIWSSTEELASLWQADRVFTPEATRADADARHAGWLAALGRSRNWYRAAES